MKLAYQIYSQTFFVCLFFVFLFLQGCDQPQQEDVKKEPLMRLKENMEASGQVSNEAIFYNRRGNSKVESKQYEEAFKDFVKAIELEPNFPEAHHNICNLKYVLGKYEDALPYCDKAIELDPSIADAYSSRAVVKEALKQHQEALDDYTRAIEINKGLLSAYFNRGALYNNMKEYDKAIRDFSKVFEIGGLKQREKAVIYKNLAEAKEGLGLFEEAIDACTHWIEVEPESSDPYNYRGYKKIAIKKHKSAIEDFNNAIKFNSKNAYAYNNRGLATVPYFFLLILIPFLVYLPFISS